MNAHWQPSQKSASLINETPAGGLAAQHSFCLRPGLGHGWAQMHEFGNGLVLGRLQCRLSQSVRQHFDCDSDSLRLMLLLQGGQCVTDARGCVLQAQAGDVVVRNGHPGKLRTELAACVPLASVALDAPRCFVAALQAEGLPLAHLGHVGSCMLLRPRANVARQCLAAGQRLLALGREPGLLARLELESLALGLLHQLLAADDARVCSVQDTPRRWQRAVDEALHILHTEWNQPLTISQLARRAGINECYLKEMFRQRTGQTIAAYLRSLRMKHALRLLESGQSTLKEAAHICGYSRADKFSQAFRRVHGVMPSQISRPSAQNRAA